MKRNRESEPQTKTVKINVGVDGESKSKEFPVLKGVSKGDKEDSAKVMGAQVENGRAIGQSVVKAQEFKTAVRKNLVELHKVVGVPLPPESPKHGQPKEFTQEAIRQAEQKSMEMQKFIEAANSEVAGGVTPRPEKMQGRKIAGRGSLVGHTDRREARIANAALLSTPRSSAPSNRSTPTNGKRTEKRAKLGGPKFG